MLCFWGASLNWVLNAAGLVLFRKSNAHGTLIVRGHLALCTTLLLIVVRRARPFLAIFGESLFVARCAEASVIEFVGLPICSAAVLCLSCSCISDYEICT